MRIHVLPVSAALQPTTQPFRYPAHNADFGVEQDMLRWLNEHPESLTDDPDDADWHYLPVFWTRWHLNHDYGRTGRDELATLVAAAVADDRRTFTVCQNDDGPLVDLGRSVLMLASRKSADGIDIPLLSSAHRRPRLPVRARWRASFVGRLDTHPIRREMAKALEGDDEVRVLDGEHGTRRFVRTTLASKVVLSPRGYGGSSFRIYEAAQLGRVPLLLGDLDTRPFKSALNWSSFSLYTDDPSQLPALIRSVDTASLDAMGRAASKAWEAHLTFGRWCHHALDELPATA
jgi:hypothetical protein